MNVDTACLNAGSCAADASAPSLAAASVRRDTCESTCLILFCCVQQWCTQQWCTCTHTCTSAHTWHNIVQYPHTCLILSTHSPTNSYTTLIYIRERERERERWIWIYLWMAPHSHLPCAPPCASPCAPPCHHHDGSLPPSHPFSIHSHDDCVYDVHAAYPHAAYPHDAYPHDAAYHHDDAYPHDAAYPHVYGMIWFDQHVQDFLHHYLQNLQSQQIPGVHLTEVHWHVGPPAVGVVHSNNELLPQPVFCLGVRVRV